MVRYRIHYNDKCRERSDRARMAIDLKPIYWEGREIPKDWYWFEGNINIVSVPGYSGDCLILECKHMDDGVNWEFRNAIVQVPTIDSMAWDQGDDFWITMFARWRK